MTTPEPAGPAERQRPADNPGERLVATPPGTRIVVRSRIVSGFTDTIGVLVGCDGTIAEIDTRAGRQQVVVAHVAAMRVVPPPPDRRSRPGPPAG